MRIAIVTETFLPKWDGIANTLCHLLDHLEHAGHTVQLFAPDGVVASYGKAKVVHFPSIAFPLYPSLRLAPPISDMRHNLEEFAPDIMHVVGPISLGIEGLRRAKELSIPTVASFHTDVAGFAQQWGLGLMSDIIWNHLRDLHNRADLTLAPSLFTKRQLEGAGFERVEVWSRGVDTQKFSPRYASAQMRDRLSAGEPAKPLLIFVGRLSPEKRIDLLRPVMDANPHVRLAIIGDGPQEKSLKRMFANTPTVFTGALRGHELSQAYASANIFAYTGAHETFGNVVLEAMASGLAVIAPQAGGLLDFAQHGDNALLYKPANSRQLSSFVSDVSGDPRLAGDLAYFALQTAQALTWQDTLDRLVMRYESLIHPQGHPVDLAVSKTSQIQIA